MSVEEGDLFPEFDSEDQHGHRVRMAELRGRSVVVYFYPKDLTPGCTREAIDFDRRLDELRSLGAELVGVSVDPADSHQRFATSCGLRFPLLSDQGGELARRLGILNERGMARRTTYLLGPDGVVRQRYNVQHVDGHAGEVVDAVRRLATDRADG